jgi:hypothetical protein
MSYESQAQLTADVVFQQRTRSCMFQQASTFKDSLDPMLVTLSEDLLKSRPDVTLTFHNMICAAPGLADQVIVEGGIIDQTLILDAEILANTQALYPAVAGLYYNEDGTPIQ